MTSENIEDLEEFEEGEEQEKDLKKDFILSISDTVTWSSDWTLESINNQIKRGNINLSPGFQRRDAWDIEKKSRFIESLLLGLPIPQLVLAEDEKHRGKFIVVDGKQRLTTISQFLRSEFKLRGLSYKKLDGFDYSKMEDTYKDDAEYLLNQNIRSVVLKNWKDEDLLYSIFYRLNSGALPLSPQELRAALKPGPIMEFLAKYAENSEALKLIYSNKKPDPRMKDIELILRYISFAKFAEKYVGDYKSFLDSSCDYFNADWTAREAELTEILSSFEEKVLICHEFFGDKFFRRFTKDGWESRFSRAVFDIETYFIDRSISIEQKDNIIAAFQNLCKDNHRFLKSITSNTNNIKNTSTRFALFGKEIERITTRPSLIPPEFIDRLEIPGEA